MRSERDVVWHINSFRKIVCEIFNSSFCMSFLSTISLLVDSSNSFPQCQANHWVSLLLTASAYLQRQNIVSFPEALTSGLNFTVRTGSPFTASFPRSKQCRTNVPEQAAHICATLAVVYHLDCSGQVVPFYTILPSIPAHDRIVPCPVQQCETHWALFRSSLW